MEMLCFVNISKSEFITAKKRDFNPAFFIFSTITPVKPKYL